MRSRIELIDREMLQPFVVLVLFSGIALVLSIPWAQRVGDLGAFSLSRHFPIYFPTQAFLLGTLGLSLGAASVLRGEPRRVAVGLLVERVLLGQLLTLPYLLFMRTLYPGKDTAFLLILTHTTAVSLACALGSRLLQEPSRSRFSHAYPSKYLLFITYCLAPLPTALPGLSPLWFSGGVLRGETWTAILLSLSVPALALAFLLLKALQDRGGD